LSSQNNPTQQYTIYALTRSPASFSSRKLAALPGVKVLNVDADCMDNPSKVFADLQKQGIEKGQVYGVFSVQGYVSDQKMYTQGSSSHRPTTLSVLIGSV
jgi:hypothetical protein